MKTKVLTLRDSVGDYFTPPFFAINIADAIRSVSHLVNTESEAPIFKNPSDFVLYELGEYDDSTASFELHPNPLHICNCNQLVRRSEEVQND